MALDKVGSTPATAPRALAEPTKSMKRYTKELNKRVAKFGVPANMSSNTTRSPDHDKFVNASKEAIANVSADTQKYINEIISGRIAS